MAMRAEEMESALSKLSETVAALFEKVKGLLSSKAEDEEDPEKKETEDAEEETEDKCETEDEEETEDEAEEKKDSEAMDSLKSDNKKLQGTVKKLVSTVDSLKKDGVKILMGEIGKRNTLAESLSQHIGTFDHAEMTLDEVAVYGAEKLELKCEKGTELATVNGFLHNRQPSTTGHGLDSKTPGQDMDGLDDYIKGGK